MIIWDVVIENNDTIYPYTMTESLWMNNITHCTRIWHTVLYAHISILLVGACIADPHDSLSPPGTGGSRNLTPCTYEQTVFSSSRLRAVSSSMVV